MTNNENTYGGFADMTFTVDGKDMNVQQFCNLMNEHITSDDPREFLPVLGGLDRRNSLVLVELTSLGALSPSYNAYGFMLLKTLTKDTKEIHELYKNGSELFVELHGDEIQNAVESAMKENFGVDVSKKESKPKKNNKNNKNKKKN